MTFKALLIDNYDSFAHNLARYIELSGQSCDVIRNDALSIEDIKAAPPQAIILSPGPCTPKEAGICVELIKEIGAYTPILGVCLGHQCIGEAYGANTRKAGTPVHGIATPITHDSTGLFKDLPSPLDVGRYHSLIVELPENSDLEITAQSEDTGEIMALRHKAYPVYGIQFHPESILTPQGMQIIMNFKHITEDYHKTHTGMA